MHLTPVQTLPNYERKGRQDIDCLLLLSIVWAMMLTDENFEDCVKFTSEIILRVVWVFLSLFVFLFLFSFFFSFKFLCTKIPTKTKLINVLQ